MNVHSNRVLASGRRLAEVGRPAVRGRAHHHRVTFRPAPWGLSVPTAHWMAAQLAAEVGPARVGPVVLEAFHDHEAAGAALRHPRFAGEPVERLTAALAGYDAAVATLGAAVLLVAHCQVLWPQVEPSPLWRLS